MSCAAYLKPVTAFAVFAACCALEWSVSAETPAPLTYRRVYVPDEALPNQIRGLLPLKREEFEQRLALAGMQGDRTASRARLRIEQAMFRARLEANHLTDGTAELAIVASGQEPSFLSLEPCNVALQSAAWQSNDRRAAIIGADLAGTLRCLVEHSGTLNLHWSQSPASTTAGEITFDLRLPAAPRRRLEIAAPVNVELTTDSGLIAPGQPTAEEPNQRLWTIELTGNPLTRLHVRRVQPDQDAGPLVVVREATNYSVLGSDVDLETTLTLDVAQQPLKHLELQVDPALQITAVRLGERSLPFSSAAASAEKPSTVTVELADELLGSERVVEISATCEWPGVGRWTLPRMKLGGAVLQEARVAVNAPSWLRLQARPLAGCTQTQASPAASSRSSDRFEFQLFESDAAIEIVSDQPAALLHEESGTQITVESNQITAVLVAELTSLGANRFAALAQVPRQWIVDSVETQPPDMLADRSLSARGSGLQLLQLKLARPMTAQRPLRLVVRGHYRRPANNQPLGAEFFRLARFPEVRDGRRLVAVRINEPGTELRLAGDENLARLHPAQLAPTELKLFESPPGSLLFEAGTASETLTAALQAATAHYRADVLVRAEAVRGGMQQTISLRCQPEASAVGSLVVRVAPRPRGDATWRLVGEESRELPAVLESQPAGSGGSEAGVYRLILPRPQSSAFEVTCHWSVSQAAEDEISLAWLPEAHRQTGMVEVHSADSSVLIQTSDVQPLPRPPTLDDRFTTLRGRYHYKAGRRAKVSVAPAPAGTVQQGAWIETLQLSSHFSPDGGGEHEATFTIRNAGVGAFQMRLPPGVMDCRLVSGEGTEESLATVGAENEVRVPLPELQRKSVVRVRYTSRGRGLGAWPTGKLTAPVPQADLPVLAQRWDIRLPPSLAALTRIGDDRAWHEFRSLGDGRSLPSQSTIQVLGRAFAGPELASRLALFSRPAAETSSDPAFRGWSVLALELPRGAEATLAVYRPAIASAWSFCLALISVSIVLRLKLQAFWIGPVAGLLAAVAIASNPPMAWWVGGAGMGLLAGGGLLLFRRAKGDASDQAADQSRRSTILLPSGHAGGVVALLLVFALARSLFSAPPDSQVAAAAGRARVVFPIDDNQQPAGEYVYLEPRFYDDLLRMTDVRPSDVPVWLFEGARFELPAATSLRTRGAAVDELRAQFDFHTFHAAVTVPLPMRRDQILLLEGRARLDGHPVTLAWQADGQALSLLVEAPGKHRLELALGAVARRTADAVTLDIAIPPAAISTVIIPRTGPAHGQVISPAGGSVLADGLQHFHLTCGGRLAVRWPTAEAAAAAAATLEADQLLWWKVRSGSVMLEARFRLRPPGGPVREAVIEVDPRLRLFPGLASGPIGRVRVEEGVKNLVKVELAEPAAADVQFRLAWLWPDALGVGKLLLPSVSLRADRTIRDWTAVSVEPGLEISRVPVAGGAPSAADFVQAWGDFNVIPDVIFGASAGEQYRVVAVRPVTSLPAANQTVDWSISSLAAKATCTVELMGVPGTRFEHRLSLPQQLKASRVALSQAGRPAGIRWTQQADGLLVVTLLEAPAAEQTINVVAELPNSRPQFGLPAIDMMGAIPNESRLRIFRQGDVQISMQPPAGWSRQDDMDLGQYRRGLGRLAAAFVSQGTDGGVQPTISRLPNRPQLAGKMFLRANQADGDWRCEANLDLEISGGVLDELRLSIPEEWSGPLEIEPMMEQRIDSSPGESRRQLTIRPREAVTGRLQVSLRGPLHSGATGVQAPDVAVLGGHAIERLVLLDRGSAGERIDWETTGLLAAGAGAAAALPAVWRDTGGDLYRVIGPRFDATARIRQSTASAPRVHLADLRAAVRPGRRLSVVALLTVQSANALDASFTLPPGCRLVQALVDGVATPCTTSGLRSWTLAVPSDVLPYRLTIVYDTFLPADTTASNLLRLNAPQLIGMEVQQSLWSVRLEGNELDRRVSDPAMAPRISGHPAQPCGQQQAELVRFEASVRALEDLLAAQGSNVPTSVLAESYVRWQRAVDLNHRQLLESADQGDAPSEMTKRMQAALDAAAKVRQRLVQAAIIDDSRVDSNSSVAAEAEPPPIVHVAVPGPAEELQLSWSPRTAPWPSSRAVTAVGLAIAALMLWLLPRSVAARNWLTAHAHFVVAAVGFGWWLLAPLGWLGWLVLLTAVWLSFRSPWTRATYANSTLHHFSGNQLR